MFLLGNRGWIFAKCQSRKSRAHHLALRPCLVLQGAAEGHGAKPSRRIPRPLLACSERNQYGNADTQSIARLAEAREERKVHKLADLAFPMDLCWKCHQTIWRTTRAALLQNYQLHKHETNYRTFPSGICKRTFPDAPWSSEVRIGSSTIELVNKKLSKQLGALHTSELIVTYIHAGVPLTINSDRLLQTCGLWGKQGLRSPCAQRRCGTSNPSSARVSSCKP